MGSKVRESFSNVCSALKGCSHMHMQLADYFDFLGLMGFKRQQEYYHMMHTAEIRGVHRWYINRYNMLFPRGTAVEEDVIPTAWDRYSRMDVDASARKTAVKNAMAMWVNKATQSKEKAEEAAKALLDEGCVADYDFMRGFVRCLDKELKCATRQSIRLAGCDYDAREMFDMQHDLHEKYRKKTAKVGEYLAG